MKKFKLTLPLFTVMAVVALIIAVSAFTSSPGKQTLKKTDTFYWYVVEDGEITGEYSSSPMARDDAKNGDCQLIEGVECLRGYESPLEDPVYPIEEPEEGDALSIFRN